jgi:hypothetical protein
LFYNFLSHYFTGDVTKGLFFLRKGGKPPVSAPIEIVYLEEKYANYVRIYKKFPVKSFTPGLAPVLNKL